MTVERRLRILLSAYACEPDVGSEPGVGWRWATGLARAGHDVWVITRANNRAAIEAALAGGMPANLHFAYYDLPAWARAWKRGGRGVRLYYALWQWGAYRVAKELCRELRFDVVHHLTFGVFRHPSFMGRLGLPFVFGPVGGGESAPRELRGTYPLRGRVVDLLRDAANWFVRFDPLMAGVFERAAIMLCKTRETLARIPARYRDKCLVQVEIGAEEDLPVLPLPARRVHRRFKVLYVGRLVYWKGVHLGLMAFAGLRQRHPDARMTIVGRGPDEQWLRRLAERLGIADAVTWVPWLERSAVMRVYPRFDAFLFPSLHESSGNAVLEALSSGLPAVCLDLGGPGVLVDSSCGWRVAAGGREQGGKGLADALATLAEDRPLAREMSVAAVRRARTQFSWPRQVARMERIYSEIALGHS